LSWSSSTLSKLILVPNYLSSSRILAFFSQVLARDIRSQGDVSCIRLIRSGSGCFSRGRPRPTCPLEHTGTRDYGSPGDWLVDAAYTAITAATLGPRACSAPQEAPASPTSQMYVYCTWPRTPAVPAVSHVTSVWHIFRITAYQKALSPTLSFLL